MSHLCVIEVLSSYNKQISDPPGEFNRSTNVTYNYLKSPKGYRQNQTNVAKKKLTAKLPNT